MEWSGVLFVADENQAEQLVNLVRRFHLDNVFSWIIKEQQQQQRPFNGL